MQDVDLRRAGDPGRVADECQGCRGVTQRYAVPQVAAFPPELRNLSGAVCRALRLLELHQGHPRKHRNGRIRKDQLSRLSWKADDVEARVADLTLDERAVAQRAFAWLWREHEYRGWVETHRCFLQLDVGDRDLSYSGMQEAFVEAALWPWLHIFADWCESSVKASEEWRQPFSSSENVSKYASVKASLTVKLLCDVLDFAAAWQAPSEGAMSA